MIQWMQYSYSDASKWFKSEVFTHLNVVAILINVRCHLPADPLSPFIDVHLIPESLARIITRYILYMHLQC